MTWLKQVWPVRDSLLEHYGANLLRPGEPASLLASRFPLVYLFHRYALASAINVIGSAKVPPSLVGDGQEVISVWPDASQREALQQVLRALSAKELEIPASLWKLLAPPEAGQDDPERFSSSAGYLFSVQDGGRAIADIVAGGLLDPKRMQRLNVIVHQSPKALSPAEVIAALVQAAFPAGSTTAPGDIASAVQAQVARHLMLLAADANATPEVQASALAGVYSVQKIMRGGLSPFARQLDHEITLFLANPHDNAPKLTPSGVPPGPPV